MRRTDSVVPTWLIAVAILVVVGFYALGGAGLLGTAETAEQPEATSAVATESENLESPRSTPSETDRRFSTLDALTVADLPVEAIDTLNLIFGGGPFPFDRDDTVFQNREGLLPDHERGYYREYTVITPGENDRGARRIVAGADGDLYYTHDHYQSFHEIVGIDW